MIIESSEIPAIIAVGKKPSYLWPIVLGTFITLTATALPILFVVANNDKPTGTLLSPLPDGVVAESQTTPTPVGLNFSQTINLAQNYLNKAFDLARNPNQSDTDKKAIIASLNQSLKQATNSVNLAPNNPEGYLLRAQVLTAISKINPAAASLAKQDLDLATQLAANKNIALPAPINPVNLLPDEQAASISSVVIAAPNQGTAPVADNAGTSSNANQKRFIFPAGLIEMTIKDTLVKDSSFIYLIPVDNHNNMVTLKTKTSGSFTVNIDTPSGNDIPVDYYIINE